MVPTWQARLSSCRLAGRYAVGDCLAAARDRAVFAARDRVRGDDVALKVARLGAASQGAGRELERLLDLSHPRLACPREYGRDADAGLEWLALDLVPGTTLDRALAGDGARDAALLLWQAARTLGFLHGAGLVHGDVKPANLLVRDGPPGGAPVELVVIDLGLAASHGEGNGVVRGTPRYAAPSVLAGRARDASTDLYALGASFAECLAGRVPAELAPVLDRLVDPDPDARYRSAGQVLRDLRPALPFELRRRSLERGEARFVGRAEEVAWLEAHLAELVAGRSRTALVLVTGERGAGKTRLLERAARRAALSGVAVSWGPSSARGADARRALRDALAPLVLALEVEEPELGAELARACGAFAAGGEGEVGAWLEVLDALARAAERRPVLVVVDDLEASRAATDLLSAAARVPSGSVAFLVASSSGPSDASQLAAGGRELALGRLTAPESLALLASAVLDDGALDGRALEGVVAAAEGHPGFLCAAARALALAVEEGRSSEEAVLAALPVSLADALDRELAALAPDERRAVQALAVLRGAATPAELGRLSGAAPAGAPPAGSPLGAAELAGLAARGILRATPGPEPRLELRSETLSARALAGLAPEELRELHARAADALERRPEADAHALARHRLAAGQRDAALAAAPAALAALLAGHESRRALELARELEGALPPGSGELAELVGEAAADAHLDLGDLAQAERSLARLRAEARDPARRRRLARKLAVAAVGLGRPEEARALLEELVGAAGGSSDPRGDLERARALELAGQVAYELGRVGEAEELLRAGLAALADPEGDPAASSLWNNLGVVAHARARCDEARAHHERALAIRDRCGDVEGRARSLTNLGNVALSAGDHGLARRRYEESLAIKRRLGNRRSIALTLSNLSLLGQRTADFALAIAQGEEALAARLALGDLVGEVHARANLAAVWRDKGDLGRARREAELALARAQGRSDGARARALQVAASVELELGRLERACAAAREGLSVAAACEARTEEALLSGTLGVALHHAGRGGEEELRRGMEIARELADPYARVALVAAASECALGRGDAEAALALAEEGARAAESAGLALAAGECAVHCGRALHRAGQPELASEALHRGLERAQALHAPELEWRAAAGLAEFHRDNGRRKRALRWLEHCVGLFRTALERLADEALEASYLELPPRAAVLRALEESVGGNGRGDPG